MNLKNFPFFAVVLTLFSSKGRAEDPACFELETRFPYNISSTEVVFDGVDSIYIFGGLRPFHPVPGSDEIWKFNTTDETLNMVGKLPWYMSGGKVTKDGSGNFHYIGGSEYGGSWSKSIYRFDPLTSAVNKTSQLPHNFYFPAAFQYNSTTAILVNGGSPGEIYTFDTVSGSVAKKLQLPNGLSYTTVFWDEDESIAALFGQSNDDGLTQLYAYSPSEDSLVNHSLDLPALSTTPAGAYSSQYGYAIGGFPSYDKVLRLDLDSYNIDYLSVTDYPGNQELFFYDTAMVYVAQLDRIYMFGGRTYNVTCGPSCGHIQHNQIWYIQL